MILPYTYTNAKDVIELFTKNQIPTLKIEKESNSDNYYFEFKTVNEYPEEERNAIKACFNKSNLQTFMNTLKELNDFVSMMETNNVLSFNLHFDITTGKYKRSKWYGKDIGSIENEGTKPETELTYKELVDRFEELVTKYGAGESNIPGIYEKVLNGKQKKFNQITFKQLINKMREVNLDA